MKKGYAMIIYATKKTIETYKLKMPEEFIDPTVRSLVQSIIEKEQGNRLFEWGAKLFYFDGRKCLLLTNFASRMTLVMPGLEVSEIRYASEVVGGFLDYIYSDDKEISDLLKLYFAEQPYACYSRLTDKSVISSMNSYLRYYLWNGNRMYDYIWDNILHSKELNKKCNKEYPFGITVNGKKEYYFPAQKFAELLRERYYQ
ncbi:MAG: hypothetical protein LUG95_04030 [Clostridiales bacterium]|nr:hypothetical protein [Clostridiales bacterium]